MRNPISLAGVALAIVSLANIFLFFVIDNIATKPSAYVGMLAYMVSPGFLVLMPVSRKAAERCGPIRP